MAYNIGQFTKTGTGFTGRIETLALKAEAKFQPVSGRTSENAPVFEIFHGDLRIGAAWERQGTKGKFLSVSFEDPSFSAGYYNLYRNGTEDNYTLTFERPKAKRKD
jgi:uncharacterized protein (DUF736 family)